MEIGGSDQIRLFLSTSCFFINTYTYIYIHTHPLRYVTLHYRAKLYIKLSVYLS